MKINLIGREQRASLVWTGHSDSGVAVARTQTRAAPRYADEGPRTGHSRDRIRGRIRRRVGETSLLCRAGEGV